MGSKFHRAITLYTPDILLSSLEAIFPSQKRVFGFLSREMMRMRHHGVGMGPGEDHRLHGEEEGGPDEEE